MVVVLVGMVVVMLVGVVGVTVVVVTVHRLVLVIRVVVVPSVVVVAHVAMANVVVLLEGAAFSERSPNQARQVGELDYTGVAGQRLQRRGERGLNQFTNQEDDIGILQRGRVGGGAR